jgi:hypothetical protein
VSSETDPLTVSLHGTAAVNGCTQRPPFSSTASVTTGCPSTSTVAWWIPPPLSVAEKDALRTPASGFCVSRRSPDGVPVNTGSAVSRSVNSARWMRIVAPELGGQVAG